MTGAFKEEKENPSPRRGKSDVLKALSPRQQENKVATATNWEMLSCV